MDLFDRLENKNIIKQINEIFYEKIYGHPWISLYFKNVEKKFIVQQQTDFIVGALGGPKKYSGRFPSNAHPHMMITHELYDLRESLLIEAFKEINAPNELQEAWLKIDESFRSSIVKESESELEKRYFTDEILNFEKPKKTA